MAEIKKTVENKKSTPWRFWFLVTFSVLLVVIFVFYLPLRFEHSVGTRDDDAMHEQELSVTDEHADAPETLEDNHEEAEDHHNEEVVDDHAHATEQIKPLVSSIWWLLLGVSSVLIALLSFGIYKFIHVKK